MEVSQAYASDKSSALADVATQLGGGQELGKEDFLELLVTQMQNQDPLEPMDNQDLVLQLSQLSTLEGTQNLNENFTEFLGTSYMGVASGMLGKEVRYYEATTDGMQEYTGTVDKVNIMDDVVTLVVDGKEILMTQVASIATPAPTAEATE